MKKSMLIVPMILSLPLLTSCVTETAYYDPGYRTSYTYSTYPTVYRGYYPTVYRGYYYDDGYGYNNGLGTALGFGLLGLGLGYALGGYHHGWYGHHGYWH